MSELRMMFGGNGLPATREDQLYSTDEDGVMRFNSVVAQPPTDDEQMFLRSENNAS